MTDFITTHNSNELVNLDSIEAVFIKNPPSVDFKKMGRDKNSIDAEVARLAKTFKVIARGTGTYILFEGTLDDCKKYIDEL